ncbi:MAG TPA: NAD-dependent epimerase/dehydratase family protein, partial [bacterium]|nr:NAD-dependent epimerase/dehydratase family protein [bacterium]
MTPSSTGKLDHYLVTGGAGFLGINLVRFLRARHHPVTSLDVVEFDYPD